MCGQKNRNAVIETCNCLQIHIHIAMYMLISVLIKEHRHPGETKLSSPMCQIIPYLSVYMKNVKGKFAADYVYNRRD